VSRVTHCALSDVLPGPRFTMSVRPTRPMERRRRILVGDEDLMVVAFIIATLREDGHAIFPPFDGLSATELALTLK
jgi:hypothetical protein